jgi:hypothetical protein
LMRSERKENECGRMTNAVLATAEPLQSAAVIDQ